MTQNVLSIILEIKQERSGQGTAKHGFVLHSIKRTLKFSSIMKSYPKSSKECYLQFLSILNATDQIVSVIISQICGMMCF